jgi:hypothetical protein
MCSNYHNELVLCKDGYIVNLSFSIFKFSPPTSPLKEWVGILPESNVVDSRHLPISRPPSLRCPP